MEPKHRQERFRPNLPAPRPPRYWFPSRKTGWGWGAPQGLSGWLVLMGYFLLMVITVVQTIPSNPTDFLFSAGLLTGVLVLLVWWKGEPPN